ncbi:MAG TPA: hypothetical protein VNA17_00100 [Pyrinomonadaceae bacterium]|nr:hypothetical protein [Pyrinomonadaceae bacterium]
MDAYDLLKLILMVGGTLLVFGIIGVGAVYLALRLLPVIINRRLDKLAQTAKALGLEVDRTAGHPLIKPLVGVYGKHNVEVLAFRQPAGEHSHINLVSCEVFFAEPIGFSFLIKSRPRFFQEVISVFTGPDPEIGVPSFDNAYHVETKSIADLRKMLLFEPDNGMRPCILTDIFLIQKRSRLIEATDTSVKVTVEGEVHEAERIKKGLNDAIFLAERFRAAREATRMA